MDFFAPVHIENAKFEQLNNWLSENEAALSTVFILVDENTHEHCLPLLLNAVAPLQRVEILEIPSGESSKTIEIACQLWESLTELKADRKSLLINLGGGVITDLGGFVASIYMRGIKFINVPTTLLAMVDAAHGGKTGIDFMHYKNHLGLFAPAEATFVYDSFCASLPERDFIAGYAECVKHALISDAELWQEMLERDVPTVDDTSWFIEKSISIKEHIVLSDPTETGLRKVLNFGHTVGHALESLSLKNDKDPLLHGEAVAAGMLAELFLSAQVANLSNAELHIAARYISSVFPIRKIDEKQFDTLLELMQHDKKNEDDEILFSLIAAPGEGIFNCKVESYWIFEALAYVNKQVVL